MLPLLSQRIQSRDKIEFLLSEVKTLINLFVLTIVNRLAFFLKVGLLSENGTFLYLRAIILEMLTTESILLCNY